ncbi:hypothetical protein F7734_00815 [Scytonema sp. UIC 10036]|uniref:hypothetical protein n=1 Tax=Scytonema sp. UIC 10036 TaxID=2304196 RepID=UPI0012DA78F0|nr:hypothetical protein [Scytonema sp. UIC 10036]MUG91117.1 hypothetical protein [Scytonema sp. UIC 10036]
MSQVQNSDTTLFDDDAITPQRAMELLFGEGSLERAVQIEDEAEVDTIGAGLDWGNAMPKLMLNSTLFGRLTTLRVSLNLEARLLIETWNLGIGTKIATTTARIHIKQRLQSPTQEAEQRLQAVLLQDDLYGEEFIRNSEVLRSLLKVLLTESDWQAIALSAAEEIRKQVMYQVNESQAITV